uniref:Transposase n=1 Tax=Steinernema glaseri TaxID=37863 RepID=A0A1I8AKK0_9BILA
MQLKIYTVQSIYMQADCRILRRSTLERAALIFCSPYETVLEKGERWAFFDRVMKRPEVHNCCGVDIANTS